MSLTRTATGVVLALLVLTGCASTPAAEQTTPTVPVTPTTTRPDAGIAACKTVARRAKAGVVPTDTQRAAVWRQLQGSHHENLRAVGAKLEAAWTRGTLADQMDANVNAAMACATHGIAVPQP